MGRVKSSVAVTGLSLLAMALLVHDSGQAPTPPESRLSASIKLDKHVYAQGEAVLAEVTVTNDGPVTEQVALDCVNGKSDFFTINYLAFGEDWVGLTARGLPEVTLAPAESFTTTVSGVVSSSAANVGTLGAMCQVNYDGSGGWLVMAETEAAVIGASNAVTGQFTICRDDGPGVAGVRLTLERSPDGSGAASPEPWTAITDTAGRFTFPVVATGPYQLRYEPPPGYKPGVRDLLVTGDDLRWQGGLTVTTTDPATSCE